MKLEFMIEKILYYHYKDKFRKGISYKKYHKALGESIGDQYAELKIKEYKHFSYLPKYHTYRKEFDIILCGEED